MLQASLFYHPQGARAKAWWAWVFNTSAKGPRTSGRDVKPIVWVDTYVHVCLAVRFNSKQRRGSRGQMYTRTLYVALYDHNYARTRMCTCSIAAALAGFSACIHRTFSARCCCSALFTLLYSAYMLGRCVERGVISTDVSHKPHMYITSHHSILRPPWGSLCFAPL